jgi:death on curing protein
MNYFTLQYAIKVHDIILDISGGKHGMLNEGYLETAIEHIQNDTYYPEFVDKLSYLIFSVSKNHAFVDGNKRSAIILGAYFILINFEDSRYYLIGKFMREMENIVVNAVENKIDRNLLREIVHSILTEDDYNEDLKLRIIASIEKDVS